MQTSNRKRGTLAAALALGLIGAALPIAGAAVARPVPAPDGIGLVDSSRVIRAYGERYCWSDTGWRGQGWYVCGDNWWRGHGWYGWRRFPLPHHHHHHPHPAPQPGKPPGTPPGKPPGGPAPGGPAHPPGGPSHPPGGPGGGPRPPRP